MAARRIGPGRRRRSSIGRLLLSLGRGLAIGLVVPATAVATAFVERTDRVERVEVEETEVDPTRRGHPAHRGTSTDPTTSTTHHVGIALTAAAGGGAPQSMLARVCRPPGHGPFAVVLFSHGRAATPAGRRGLAEPVPATQVAYWLARGYAVVAPWRPGYGPTGGPDVESHGARFDRNGRCTHPPDFARVAARAQAAIADALTWIGRQPWADRSRIVLIGQSAGGIATIAAAAEAPAGVIGYVNCAGGLGGRRRGPADGGCDPARLQALCSELGSRCRVTGLWLYARDDPYWGPVAPIAWHSAYVSAGGVARFTHLPADGSPDPHGVARAPVERWRGPLDAFLAEVDQDAAPVVSAGVSGRSSSSM